MTNKNRNTINRSDIKDETKIEVNLPSCIKIELVQGNELRHYEIFIFLGTLALSTAVGFWTSYTTTPNGPLLYSSIAFSILSILSIKIAIYYRSRIYNGKITKVTSLNKFKIEKI